MLFIDLETYAASDLKKQTVYSYAEDPSLEILMCAWSLEPYPDTVEIAVGEDHIREIPYLLNVDMPIVAHNAQFERVVLGAVFGEEYFPIERFIDTQAMAAEAGWPRKLEKLALALGVKPKDTAGTRLINTFSKPNRGKRIFPENKPDKWEEFKRYCVNDVETLIECYNALPEMTDMENRVYTADQRINDRGITVDLGLAREAVKAAEQNQAAQAEELMQITGISNPRSNQQLLEWCQKSGLKKMRDLKAATVEKLLTQNLTPEQRRVLELRRDLALVASKKFIAALDSTCADGRFRGGFQFFGAHTGRWAGRRIQLQNLPRLAAGNEEAAILDLMMGNGADAQTLKGLVRPLFVGPFTVLDYSAIEARVLAWLAGEQWVLDAFIKGRDIYVETAERMGGLTRAQGKVAVLALGYNGGINSLRVMGAEGTDEELQVLVWQWRNANPKIVQFWKKVESAFWSGGRAGRLVFEMRGKDRAMVLPGGRSLVYHNVKKSQKRLTFDDPKGYRTDTYGGRLVENATQAVARDILAEALVRLEDRGYEVALHIHDEIGVYGEHPVDEIAKIMCELPDWAEGLPIDAEGQVCQRYQKM
jgi:DNA polymerase